jgi:hypothetical protein
VTRKCVIYSIKWFLDEFPEFKDTEVAIYIDEKNFVDIVKVLKDNKKKFRRILYTILKNQFNNDLYGKEPSSNSKHVTAMKFKGNSNERIYCKEFFEDGKRVVMITTIPKKVQKNNKTIKNLLDTIGGYTYEYQEEE